MSAEQRPTTTADRLAALAGMGDRCEACGRGGPSVRALAAAVGVRPQVVQWLRQRPGARLQARTMAKIGAALGMSVPEVYAALWPDEQVRR